MSMIVIHFNSDIDECLQEDICSYMYVCHNTLGSYECTCKTGYLESDSNSCHG